MTLVYVFLLPFVLLWIHIDLDCVLAAFDGSSTRQ